MSEEDDDIPPVVTGDDEENEVTSIYTRAEAIEDGTLKDVTARAREAGIKLPTAVTRAVWSDYVALTPTAKEKGEDIESRLWDIVWMLRCAVLSCPNQSEFRFQVYVTTNRIEPTLVTLKATLLPGDDGKPVITIMLPDED